MLRRLREFLKTWWVKVTEPHSTNEDEARKEYMIKVFMLVLCIAVVITSSAFFFVYGGRVSNDFYLSSFIASAFVIFIVFLNYKGGWKISLYLPSLAFAVLSISGIKEYGYDLMNLMELSIFVFVTTIFLNKYMQFLSVFLCVILVGTASWTTNPGDFDNLIWWTISNGGYFSIIVGIMGFYSGQFQFSLDRARYLQDFFHSTLRSLPGIFYVFDKKGRLSQWNENVEDTTGYNPKELVELNPDDLFVKEDDLERQTFLTRFTKKSLETFEADVVTKTKKKIPHLFTGLKTKISGNEYIIGEGIDITEQKKAESKAKSLDEIRQRFIHVVSHQLRTPLTVIRWNLDSLENEHFGKLNEDQKNFASTSAKSAEVVIGRINDLLTTLDIEEGAAFVRKEVVDIIELWKLVQPRVEEICQRKNLQFSFSADKKIPTVEVDKRRIENAMWQIANNAANYTKEGRVNVSISVKEDFVRFEVQDTGIGIVEADKAMIFTKFYRGTNAETVFEDASGIGLYLTKFFVKKHSGKIGFESKENVGSTFWFELPIENNSKIKSQKSK